MQQYGSSLVPGTKTNISVLFFKYRIDFKILLFLKHCTNWHQILSSIPSTTIPPPNVSDNLPITPLQSTLWIDLTCGQAVLTPPRSLLINWVNCLNYTSHQLPILVVNRNAISNLHLGLGIIIEQSPPLLSKGNFFPTISQGHIIHLADISVHSGL